MELELKVNGEQHKLSDLPDDIPLLWVLRDTLNLVGAKFGCGGGYCGACTVHVDGVPMRSCTIPASALSGRAITTTEGLANGSELHPLQTAWIEQDVPQCGYCQSGQIMSAASLLAKNVQPSSAEIDQAMSGNICRCGCYVRIKSAIASAATELSESGVAHYDPAASNEGARS